MADNIVEISLTFHIFLRFIYFLKIFTLMRDLTDLTVWLVKKRNRCRVTIFEDVWQNCYGREGGKQSFEQEWQKLFSGGVAKTVLSRMKKKIGKGWRNCLRVP